MKKIQLFDFKGHEVGTMTDENGNPWFLAKNVCAVLGLGNVSRALHGNEASGHVGLDDDEKLTYRIGISGQTRNVWCVNESGLYALVFKSHHADAKTFRKHVTSVILPALRQTGTYTLKNQLLPAPRLWEKTFPAEFMRNVMKLYGYKYDPKKGTPSFIGHFINDYVYNTLDKGLSKALKAARTTFAGEDEVGFLHQFLADPAREALQGHIMVLNGLAAGSANIDGFKQLYERAFTHRNQLEMYLR